MESLIQRLSHKITRQRTDFPEQQKMLQKNDSFNYRLFRMNRKQRPRQL